MKTERQRKKTDRELSEWVKIRSTCEYAAMGSFVGGSLFAFASWLSPYNFELASVLLVLVSILFLQISNRAAYVIAFKVSDIHG